LEARSLSTPIATIIIYNPDWWTEVYVGGQGEYYTRR